MYYPELLVSGLLTVLTAAVGWSTAIPYTTPSSSCPVANFNAAPTFPVGTEPLAFASGDFNGDAIPDLVVSNGYPDNDLSILLGDGSGRFLSRPRLKTSLDEPFGFVVVGDFNNDGKQDLAGTILGYGGVFVMSGDGQGGFSVPVEHAAGRRPHQMVVTDINADGRDDIAVAELESEADFTQYISVLMGTPQGLAPLRRFQVVARVDSIDAGDLNGDGKIDLIVGGGHASCAFFGDGTGNFSRIVLGFDVNIGTVVKIADFNNDQKADIVFRQEVGFSNVMYGDGAGGFTNRIDLNVIGTSGAVVGDFNRDGLTDIALLYRGGIVIELGLSSGGFERRGYAAGSSPRIILMGDVNKDGKLDLATLNQKSYDVSILLGTGTGEFAASSNYLTHDPEDDAGSATSIAAGDFNRDGKMDVAVSNFHSRDVVVLIGDGRGGFVSGTSYSVNPRLPTSIHVVDTNQDGNLDILVTFNQGSILGSFLGRGDGTFQFLSVQDLLVNSVTFVTSGDFNGDGKPDIATLGGSALRIALNVAEGKFGPAKTWVVGSNPNSISVADLNGDGKLDVAVPNNDGVPEQDGVWIGLGDGAGGIASSRLMKAGRSPFGATLGDFNGDGKPDLAVSSVFEDTHVGLSIFIGNGNGGFTFKESRDARLGVGVAAGDFNGDGVTDLTVANGDGLAILLGLGNGSFSEATNYGAGEEARTVAVADFNGDGKSDVMIANYTSGTVTALISTPCIVPTPTPSPTPTPTATPTPTPSPAPGLPPVLVTVENSNRAIAFDSVTMVSDPFPLETDSNFSTDHRTRIMLFALNADLLPGENSSALLVNGTAGGQNYPMTVEYLGTVPGMDWLTQIVVRLPDQLPSGDVLVQISLRGVSSNQAVIRIR